MNTIPGLANEACVTRLCQHTYSVGLILEPPEGWIVTSSMLTPRQTNRPKRTSTSMCMEVTYKCCLLGLSLLLALAVFAHMQRLRQRDCYTRGPPIYHKFARFKHACATPQVAHHVTSISLVMVVQSNFCNRDFVIDHKFSIELRSGEFPGQSRTFNLCFLKTVFTFSDEIHEARSYWNFPSPSANAFLISGMNFLSITSMYLHKFIIPSIDISEATPEQLKLPQPRTSSF